MHSNASASEVDFHWNHAIKMMLTVRFKVILGDINQAVSSHVFLSRCEVHSNDTVNNLHKIFVFVQKDCFLIVT